MWIYEVGTIFIILVIVGILLLGIYRGFKNFSEKKVVNQARFIFSLIFAVIIIFVLLLSVVSRVLHFIF